MSIPANPTLPDSGIGPLSLRALLAPLRGDPFTLFILLSLLLLGADLFAIKAGGLTMRVVFPVLMAAFALLYLQRQDRIYFDRILTFLFMALATAGAVSILGSYEAVKSVGYTVWVLFDFFVIITLTYNYACQAEPIRVLSLWFLVYRIHVGLLLCELAWNIAHGSLGRPHVWFYESSYLAVFMTGYFGAALFMFLRCGRAWLPDFLMSFVGVLATISATGIFGMLLATLLNLILARQRLWLLAGAVTIGAIFAGTLYIFFEGTVYYNLVLGFLLRDDFSLDLILSRSGNRVIRAMVGWEAFLHHPWSGIGIGGDAAYMDRNPYPEEAWQYIHPWTDLDTGQPFSNILIEVLGTMGIAGFIPFAAIILYAGYALLRTLRSASVAMIVATAIFIGFFSIFLALQFESTFLRYYLWSPLGLALGLMAQTRDKAQPSPRPRASLGNAA